MFRACLQKIRSFIIHENNAFFTVNAFQGPPNTIFYFGKCFKKTTEYFIKFLFLLESTILSVNNDK